MPIPAMLSAALPYLGGALGGLGVGAALGKGGLGNFLTGSPGKSFTLPRYTPQQQGAFNQILQNSLSGLAANQPDFGPIENRARSQFMQQTVPGLAERFTAMGSNALSSPAFVGQLGQAGAQLEEGLAAQRAGYDLQKQQMLLQMLGLGLSPQFENFYQMPTTGFLGAGAKGLFSMLPYLGLLGWKKLTEDTPTVAAPAEAALPSYSTNGMVNALAPDYVPAAMGETWGEAPAQAVSPSYSRAPMPSYLPVAMSEINHPLAPIMATLGRPYLG